jgi:L-ascorbate metabolism protein UlaG (beta-lactamase superfamily)
MNIHYISHATLLLEAGDLKIITDPWLIGPAYCGQWHLFPKPLNAGLADAADVILLSHGREDHLHDLTLWHMPKSARVFYPYGWYGGIKPYLSRRGFGSVCEAITGRAYRLDADTTVTYIANNLNGIVVIEHRGEVIVNVNDSLHACHPDVIDAFITAINERWPRIDLLFCGFGGGGYFPNAVHAPRKDDVEIAHLREQILLHNFCTIVHGLAPRVAVPFVADVALLAPWQRWINTTRFPREEIAGYYRSCFDDSPTAPRIIPMYSGDVLRDGVLAADSPYRERMIDGSLDHLIEEQYATEIAMREVPFFAPEWFAADLQRRITANIARRCRLFEPEQLEGLSFSVVLTDVAHNDHYNALIRDGTVTVERAEAPAPDCVLLLRTTSTILDYSISSDWGGDAITIGHGAEVFLFEAETAERGLDTVCMRLLMRHPTIARHMWREPIRAAKFLATNPITRAWAMQGIFHPARNERELIPHREWLLRTKQELYNACNLPRLDAERSSGIVSAGTDRHGHA